MNNNPHGNIYERNPVLDGHGKKHSTYSPNSSKRKGKLPDSLKKKNKISEISRLKPVQRVTFVPGCEAEHTTGDHDRSCSVALFSYHFASPFPETFLEPAFPGRSELGRSCCQHPPLYSSWRKIKKTSFLIIFP